MRISKKIIAKATKPAAPHRNESVPGNRMEDITRAKQNRCKYEPYKDDIKAHDAANFSTL